MMFDPADAVRLFQSDEPVIAGAYAAKKLGNGQLNVDFEDGLETDQVRPLGRPVCIRSRPSGPGILRIKVSALKQSPRRSSYRIAGWPSGSPGRSSSR